MEPLREQRSSTDAGSSTAPRFGRDAWFLLGMAVGGLILCLFIRAILIVQAGEAERGLRGGYFLAKKAVLFSAFDTATIAVVTLLGWALLFLARPWPALRWAAWLLWSLIFYGVLLLAVISIPTIAVYQWPLTWELIRFSRVLSDSAGFNYVASLVPLWLLLLLAAAIAFPPLSGSVFVRASDRVHIGRGPLIAIAAVVAVLGGGFVLVAADKLADREDDYLFRNAAVVLALSAATPPMQALADYAAKRPLQDEALPAGRPPPKPGTRPRNVIFFVIESLSAQQVDGFDDRFGITPNLARLSSRSIAMSRAYAHAPSSSVALSSILESSVPLSLEGERANAEDSLVGVAKRHGFRTSFFFGGDTYKDDFQFLTDLKIDTVRDRRQIACSTKRSRNLEDSPEAVDDRCTLAALIGWIDRGKAPFLSILWNYQTHYPYFVNRLDRKFPLPYSLSPWNRDALTLYLNAAQETDAVLGELVRQLEVRGLGDDTLIVVLGDHGEAFGQHGVGGHGTDIFEESIHIPLLMLYPGFASAIRYDDLFGEVDIAPTVASLMRFERPRSWRGIDIFTGQRNRRLFSYANGRDALVGYRENNDKIVLTMPQPTLADLVLRRSPDVHESFHRYDLRADPQEHHDLGVSSSDEKERIKARLAHWLVSQGAAAKPST